MAKLRRAAVRGLDKTALPSGRSQGLFLKPLVLTICTNRKRVPPPPILRGRSLEEGSAESVAAEWRNRLRSAEAVVAVKGLYAGRGFREAERAATAIGGELVVLSAGLGLVGGDQLVPSYSLTLSRTDPDGVLARARCSAGQWWRALQSHSPFNCAIDWDDRPILAAVSAPYLDMVSAEWASWRARRLSRLRLFTKRRPSGPAADLAAVWMPYDDRLDAAADDLPGTQGDFAQRALRHFVETRGAGVSPAEDATAVERALRGLTRRVVPDRQRLTDEAIITLIIEDWDVIGGRSGAMLRRLRDEHGVGCQQDRFKNLFKRAAWARERSLP